MPVCAALAALCLFSAHSSTIFDEHKGVIYTPPKNWNSGDEGEAKVFAPKSLKPEEVVVMILTPAMSVTKDPHRKQFEASVSVANDGAKVLSKTEVLGKEGPERSLYIQSMQIESPEIGKHHRIYAMVFSPTQKALIMVIGTTEQLLEKFMDEATEFIGSINFKSAGAINADPAKPVAPGKIPTGNTPGLYPGSPGWLPSGTGLPIPAASIANGKPQGLWWRAETGTNGLLKPVVCVFLPNGIRASRPRLGGANLFDYEGQKNSPGNTGIGTFEIVDGKFIEKSDRFTFRSAYSSGTDGNGKYFKTGASIYRPLVPLTKASIVGSWKALGTQYIFKGDGTFEMGTVASNGDWTVGGMTRGQFVLDGYLLMIVPEGAPMFIDVVGLGGPMLVKGSTFYVKG